VYDIYGAQGLEAGLELGDKLASPDDLKKEWAAFQARTAAAAVEAKVAHRGAYVVRVDATDAVGGLGRAGKAGAAPGAALVALLSPQTAPEVAAMAMSTQVQVPLGARSAATVGGQVGVRRGAGGGALIAGLRRVLDAATTVDAHAQVGLRTLLAASTTRQLGDRVSAGLALSFQPADVGEAMRATSGAGVGGPPASLRHAVGAALGVTLTSTRRLGEGTEADAVWTVGPAAAGGAAVGVTHRRGSVSVGGRVEVGLAGTTAVSARLGWRPGGGATAYRLSARAGPAGAEVEVGASRRVSDVAVLGLGLAAGTGGVVLKPRFARGGHSFEVPVLLAAGGPAGPDVADLPAVAVALVAPPLIAALAHYALIRPLSRSAAGRAARSKRAAAAGEVREVLARAAATAAALAPVGRRRARKEAASPTGLVVVRARYGPPGALDADDAAVGAACAGAVEGADAADTPAASPSSIITAPLPYPDALDDEVLAAHGGIIDVTPAVRLLVEGGRLRLAGGGVPRHGLLGFCDPAPGEPKALSIRFVAGGQAYRVRVADGAVASLPERAGGALPAGTAEAGATLEAARELAGGGGE